MAISAKKLNVHLGGSLPGGDRCRWQLS